jgi:hypothetical protein
MQPVHSFSEWTREFIKAIGEDGHKTRDITLHIPLNGAVTVTVERLIDDNSDAVEIIKKVAWIEETPEKEN